MTFRLAIRGYAEGALVFEELVDVADGDIDRLVPKLAEKHALSLATHRLHMVEIEFLDEANPDERFFRFGTDPSGMVMPIGIDLGDTRRAN
jgi:hypothetical protein